MEQVGDPRKRAGELRTDAERLLSGTGLLALLGEYGTVQPTGSYLYDLMTWRDIDLCLAVEEPSPETVLEIGKRVSVIEHVGSMYFRNEFVLRTEGNPRAIFLCVDFHLPDGPPWKVDILVADPEEVERVLGRGRELLARLTPETRGATLAIKGELCAREGYRREFGSRQVYEAVLDHGIRTVEEWDEWFRKQQRRGRTR